jgi:hypothetical protein
MLPGVPAAQPLSTQQTTFRYPAGICKSGQVFTYGSSPKWQSWQSDSVKWGVEAVSTLLKRVDRLCRRYEEKLKKL